MQQQKKPDKIAMAVGIALIIISVIGGVQADRDGGGKGVDDGGWAAIEAQQCDIGAALQSLSNCALADQHVQAIVSPKMLGIGDDLEKADWATFAENIFWRESAETAVEQLLERSGGVKAAAASMQLVANEAAYGDNQIAVRQHICGAARRVLQCANVTEKRCFGKTSGIFAKAPITIGLRPESKLKPALNVDTMLAIIEQTVCVLCENKGERLQRTMSKWTSPTMRKASGRILHEELGDTRKGKCGKHEFDKGAERRTLGQILDEQPCKFYRVAKCAAKRVDNETRAGRKEDTMQAIVGSVFRNAFECKSVSEMTEKRCAVEEKKSASANEKRSGTNRATGAVTTIAVALATAVWYYL